MGLKLRDIDITKITKNLGIYQLLHHHEADKVADYSARGIIFLDNLREQAKKAGTDLNSVTAEMITAAIPGDWDNNLRIYIRDTIVPKVISNSLAVSECLEEPTTEQQIVCLFNIVVPQKPENERTLFWNGLAALFAHEIGLFLSGQKIDFLAILQTIPQVFLKLFKKK